MNEAYESACIEPIVNGFLVILTRRRPEAWEPAQPTTKVMGVELQPTDTYYAPCRETAIEVLREHYFA